MLVSHAADAFPLTFEVKGASNANGTASAVCPTHAWHLTCFALAPSIKMDGSIKARDALTFPTDGYATASSMQTFFVGPTWGSPKTTAEYEPNGAMLQP